MHICTPVTVSAPAHLYMVATMNPRGALAPWASFWLAFSVTFLSDRVLVVIVLHVFTYLLNLESLAQTQDPGPGNREFNKGPK